MGSQTDALARALAPARIAILWADADLILVDKPAGVPSQKGRDGALGVVEWLWRGGFSEAALHHRLDRPASGVLALALSKRANPGLARQFRERTASRTYRAVLGAPVDATLWSTDIDGQEAFTDVEPLGQGSGFTAAQLRLRTGRTHQIRRHAARHGAPILGDQRYAGELGRAWTRLALHAWRLELEHPVSGEPVHATAPLPRDLTALWSLAGGPKT